MEPFKIITGAAAPILRENINTDAIIAARALTSEKNLGERVFTNWRFDLDGNERPDFPLNQERFRQAKIVLALKNFGCGSSREAAVWALKDFGIRAVIAPSFGQIFEENALQNGMLPVRLDVAKIIKIAEHLDRNPVPYLTVNLDQCEVMVPQLGNFPFQMDPERRRALLGAISDLDLLLDALPKITAFEVSQRCYALNR